MPYGKDYGHDNEMLLPVSQLREDKMHKGIAGPIRAACIKFLWKEQIQKAHALGS